MSDSERKAYLSCLSQKYKNKKNAVLYEKAIFDRCGEGEYPTLGFQLLGFLMSDLSPPAKVMKDIQSSLEHWDMSSFQGCKDLQLIDINRQLDGLKIEKSDYKCRNKRCGSMQTYYWLEQTRSADEGMTTFVVCSVCNTRSKIG